MFKKYEFVMEIIEGLREISCDDYVLITTDGKLILNSDSFEYLFR